MDYVLVFAAGVVAYPLTKAAWAKYVAPRIAKLFSQNGPGA